MPHVGEESAEATSDSISCHMEGGGGGSSWEDCCNHTSSRMHTCKYILALTHTNTCRSFTCRLGTYELSAVINGNGRWPANSHGVTGQSVFHKYKPTHNLTQIQRHTGNGCVRILRVMCWLSVVLSPWHQSLLVIVVNLFKHPIKRKWEVVSTYVFILSPPTHVSKDVATFSPSVWFFFF